MALFDFAPDVGRLMAVSIPYIIATQAGGEEDPVKHAQVVHQLQAILDEPGGLEFPKWLKPAEPLLIDGVIWAMVKIIKATMPDFSPASKPLSPKP